MDEDRTMGSRRRFIAGLGAAAIGGFAGCLGSEDTATMTTAPGTLPTPFLGPADAEVTVAVFKDYACPHCATFTEQTEPRVRSEYVGDGVVRFEHYDLPLPVRNPVSYEAANAARAVQAEASDDAFFAYADRLFANQSELGLDTFAELAEEADGETVRRAADAQVYRNTVDADRQSAIERGVEATPAVFVDGELLDGWGWSTVQSAVDAARDG